MTILYWSKSLGKNNLRTKLFQLKINLTRYQHPKLAITWKLNLTTVERLRVVAIEKYLLSHLKRKYP
jgi:hypothetical protein